jgi:Tol biopolymer transport system component
MRLALALLAATVVVPGAVASFPGRNGLIAFTSERGGVEGVFTMHTDGTRLARLTGTIAPEGAEPAVSPDGRWIAFARQDNLRLELWIARSDGSAAQAVVRDTHADVGHSLSPAWTPDGRIAYVADRSVWTVRPDGSGRRVLLRNAYAPRWSPDGRRLAFGRGVWLYVADAAGGDSRRLDHGVYPSWAPDSRRLAYLHWQCDSCAQYIAVADVVTGRKRAILRRAQPSGVAWSPDGSRIAFDTCCHDRPDGTSFNTIDTVSPSGRDRRTVVRTQVDVYDLAWSRDGHFVFDDQAELYVARAGGRVHKLFRGGADYDPIWTPDGRRILFTRAYGGLFAMTAHGGAVHRVLRSGIETLSPDGRRYAYSNDADGIDVGTFGGKVVYYDALQDDGAGDTSKWDPAFAPNGRELAYLDGTPDDLGSVSLLTLATGKARSLGVEALGDLEWSPDGRELAMQIGTSLYAFDLKTHRKRLLARKAEQPTWSPDGRRIAFVRRLGSNSEIYVVRSDGGDERRLTRNPGDDESPSWQPLR